MAVTPAFEVSASATTTKGIAPNSSLCKSLRAITPMLAKDATQYRKYQKKHDWTKEKAAYLTGIGIQIQEFQLVSRSSSHAPHNVVVAASKTLKAASSEVLLEKAKSALKFSSTGSSIVILTYNSAQKPILKYFDSQCGS